MSFIQAPVRVSILFLSMAVLWSGCTINRDIMFRTGDDFDFAPWKKWFPKGTVLRRMTSSNSAFSLTKASG